MLLKLNGEISECYRHADEARRKAHDTSDALAKEAYLDVERRWLFLAHSYELSEHISAFTSEVKRRLKRQAR